MFPKIQLMLLGSSLALWSRSNVDLNNLPPESDDSTNSKVFKYSYSAQTKRQSPNLSGLHKA